MRRTTGLYTIGYSGHTPLSFIGALHKARITALLDIRMTPISRKLGFSKTRLRLGLEEEGITYYHIRELGSPAYLRRQLAVDKDYDAFFYGFREHLAQQEHSIHAAASLVLAERVCLMCVEEHPGCCHRSVVADAIQHHLAKPFAIHHLPSPLHLH